MAVPSQLIVLARKAAAAQSLDPALVCAVVEQESAWNPWAMRYEPLFFAKYVASLYTNNKIGASEAYGRGFSWGLMQVMGQVARETGYLDGVQDFRGIDPTRARVVLPGTGRSFQGVADFCSSRGRSSCAQRRHSSRRSSCGSSGQSTRRVAKVSGAWAR